MKLPHNYQKLIVLGLALLAFGLRACRLDFQSYWIDEAWTVYFARLPLGDLLHQLQTVEIHPPLYFPSLNRWAVWLGAGEYALRFYSLVFGVLAIPFTYRLGKALAGDRLGVLAALLMAFAPYQIWHSQEARMYSMLTAASVMSMWGFVEWGSSGSRRGGWVYITGAAWTLLAHYHGLTVIGVQGLFLLLTWRRRWRGYLRWAGALALIVLLYLPWLAASWRFVRGYQGWLPQPTLAETYLRSALAYSVGELVERGQAVPLVLPFVALYALGLIYAARRRGGNWSGPELLVFLLSYTLAPNLAAWLYGELRSPVYLERYLIPVQPGFLLTVALGLLAVADGLPRLMQRGRREPGGIPPPANIKARPVYDFSESQTMRRISRLTASLLGLILVGINAWVLWHHYTDPAYAKPDWRAVIRTIDAFSLPGDAVIVTGDGGEKVFDIYYHGNLPVYYSFNTPVPSPEEARPILAGIAARHRRLWYTPYGAAIDAALEDWLARRTYPAWQRWLGRKRLALYGAQATTGLTQTLNATLAGDSGQGPTLVNVTRPEQAIAAGDLLPMTLTWQTAAPLSHDYQLSLRLANSRGDLFTQSDWPPLAAAGGTSTWPSQQPIIDRRSLWLPPDLPPGAYALQFVVYDPASGQPLGQPAMLAGVAVAAAQTVVPPQALAIPNPIASPPSPGATSNPRLVGYARPDRIKPGQEMWLWLYWQAVAPLSGGLVRLSLDSQGRTVFVAYPLADSVGPLDSWQPGQVRRAVYHLPTSPRLAGPAAQLRVSLMSVAGQVKAENTLAQIELETRARQFEPPAIAQPLDAAFGQPLRLKLLGLDVPTSHPSPGDTLAITLYWQAITEMAVDYTVFVQLLNPAGQVVSQLDLPPQAGAAPTTTWLPGEVLTDPYTLPLPADLPPGVYRLITGLYNPATGKRLPVAGGDFVELTQLTVQ
ncbi:MAG: glycosyltransferase family 39 protein [Chloroflexota bacterium]